MNFRQYLKILCTVTRRRARFHTSKKIIASCSARLQGATYRQVVACTMQQSACSKPHAKPYMHAGMSVQSVTVTVFLLSPFSPNRSPIAPNRQAAFKCMMGSYPLWTSTYLGIVVGCHQIEDGICKPG